MGSFFALDLGATAIKVCQLTLTGTKGFVLNAIGGVSNPAGSLDFADQQVVLSATGAVKQALKESGIRERRVVVAVPEAKVFSRIVEMPKMSDAELASAIKWEAEQFIPVPVSEVEIDYTVVKQAAAGKEGKMSVYLVAATKKYLTEVTDLVIGCGLEPIAIESEMVALTRSLTFGTPDVTSMLVNLGSLSSVLAIVDHGELVFSYVAQIGGVALTRALAQSLALPLPQAEEYKRTYGLDETMMEGKVRTGLLLALESLVGEMRKAMENYLTVQKTKVDRVVLSGGGAYLPGLPAYLSGVFGGIEVVMADPMAWAKPVKGVVIPKDRASYAVSIGLAMRVF
ncbi:MAG: type IV pilus assembly protein PilM [Microgenomates group bacterium GW2011_GWC1_46_16]|uniref:SHS2 domain-containing protein n=2 Tax=Candidatus Collieribacteriota TaxID=1752725 RepID=A0A1F5G0G7_9BACT|nr:MAG: type IV pilus assembly protein PilM [Microgenomates group bacterium GW2011_GWF1_46_12]KKU26395.1 MAG: type IV pilus assembly protein PilM [Microgenomates group bacterium GW2011_GWC1_46_16]KKU27803.1 MAG: type IV pilus assembly protein PilM [Microgenomates group bacterium GW2011_GWF2_46_18]KKU43839.1 MAG: type IV pilus assembly protein PilM [Microgenomates group bacterium GW2011_GWA1_46_7]KKU45407.1 MAG: type IV pilus assembly protein PilM [Microgenomates group bacterium GW2011_GWB1_46_7